MDKWQKLTLCREEGWSELRDEQHRHTATESIRSSANWPHTAKTPALQLQGSYYHVINLLRINQGTKDRGKVKGQHSDSPYSRKGGLLNKRPCSNLPTCLKASFWNTESIHAIVLIPTCWIPTACAVRSLFIMKIEKELCTQKQRRAPWNINIPLNTCVCSREVDCSRWRRITTSLHKRR